MLHKKFSLRLPIFSFCGGNSCSTFLKKSSRKVSRSSREFHFIKTFFYGFIIVQNHHWSSSNKQREYFTKLSKNQKCHVRHFVGFHTKNGFKHTYFEIFVNDLLRFLTSTLSRFPTIGMFVGPGGNFLGLKWLVN